MDSKNSTQIEPAAASLEEDAWLAEYEAAMGIEPLTAQCLPPGRKPAVAFAYLNFAEDAHWILGPPRAVLWYLAKRVDFDTGNRYLYQRQIMRGAGIKSRRACRNAVAMLCDEHRVLTVTHGRKRRGQVKPAPRLYQLHIPPGYKDV